MKSTLAKELGLESNVKALQKRGDVFGIGQALVNQIDEALDDYETKAAYWANDVYNDMTKKRVNIPVKTGNLVESIVMDDSNYLKKTFVGVDLNKLAEGYGKDRHGYHDYTEEANEANAAGGGQLQREFINAIWFEKAKNHANQRFGQLKYFRKI